MTERPTHLRIASFNIHHGARADGTLDLEGTAHTLEGIGADVIGLQEVDRHYSSRSNFVDQSRWLGERLGMHHEFVANVDLDPSGSSPLRRHYGLALLTRIPVVDLRHVFLPDPRVVERRGALVATLDASGPGAEPRLLTVVVAHLATSPSRVRRAQFRAIREVLAPTGGEAPRPAVLVGDLNAPAAHPLDYREFTGEFTDAWAARPGRRMPVLSALLRRLSGPTHPARRPFRRIDYVLASPEIRVRSMHVVDSDASDHLPVVADLELP
ncbi:MAG: endonuclease/exonuclease/phosphatase family protein [Dermabacter sp.]|nr:endonuclease/exonuclease/phosphatase family protein [Dermabacter sp.]